MRRSILRHKLRGRRPYIALALVVFYIENKLRFSHPLDTPFSYFDWKTHPGSYRVVASAGIAAPRHLSNSDVG